MYFNFLFISLLLLMLLILYSNIVFWERSSLPRLHHCGCQLPTRTANRFVYRCFEMNRFTIDFGPFPSYLSLPPHINPRNPISFEYIVIPADVHLFTFTHFLRSRVSPLRVYPANVRKNVINSRKIQYQYSHFKWFCYRNAFPHSCRSSCSLFSALHTFSLARHNPIDFDRSMAVCRGVNRHSVYSTNRISL